MPDRRGGLALVGPVGGAGQVAVRGEKPGTGNGVVVPCGARFPTLLNGEHPTLPQQLPTLVQYRRGRDCEAGSRVTERLRRGVRLCVIPAITRQDESFGVEASVPGLPLGPSVGCILASQ